MMINGLGTKTKRDLRLTTNKVEQFLLLLLPPCLIFSLVQKSSRGSFVNIFHKLAQKKLLVL